MATNNSLNTGITALPVASGGTGSAIGANLPKVLAYIESNVVVAEGYGISSITDNGVGSYTVVFSSSFANNDYKVLTSSIILVQISNRNVAGVDVDLYYYEGDGFGNVIVVNADSDWSIAIFGTQ